MKFALRPPVFDRDVLTLDISSFFQAAAERRQPRPVAIGRSTVEEPDYGHRGLLRARRERPRSRGAADERDERAALHHSITSSARASSVGGTSSPSAFAT